MSPVSLPFISRAKSSGFLYGRNARRCITRSLKSKHNGDYCVVCITWAATCCCGISIALCSVQCCSVHLPEWIIYNNTGSNEKVIMCVSYVSSDGWLAELQCFTSFVMMMAHSSQTRIVRKVDGQFWHARWWLLRLILNVHPLLLPHFGQTEVWDEDGRDAAGSFCLLRFSFAALCLSASNSQCFTAFVTGGC